jgi:hypothetical protein
VKNQDYFVARLMNNADTIRTLVQNVGDEQARWRPQPASWSILEVINHLYDEEREDFRQRLDYLLHRPGEPWPPIDPQGWVTARQYNQRDWAASLDNFLDERRQSLEWLRSLANPNWQKLSDRPPLGFVSARDMLAAWLAHDLLHLRQLIELHWAYLAQQARPIALDYAGGW